MNTTSNTPNLSVLPNEDVWAAEVAASLRLLQAAGADEPAEQRAAHIEEQVRRRLQSVPAAQRARFLERLNAQFPVGQMVAAPSVGGEAATMLMPQTPDEVAAMVSEAWARFSPEQRTALRGQLASAGVIEAAAAAPADTADYTEVKRAFALGPNESVVAQRLGRLAMMEADFVTKLDQLAWSTWKQVSPQSPLKRESALGDLRTQMRRYLKGDAEITDLQMAQQIDRTRQLASSLLGSLAVTSRGFLKRYQTRYGPEAVKDVVKMEGGLGAFGNEGKFWRKYVELAAEINDLSIQTDMMESISRFVEDMMKTRKT